MRSLWIVLLITSQLGERVAGNYQCTMSSFEVSCSGINTDELPQNIAVTLNKTDIVTLNITNGIIPTISPITFEHFVNLQSLYVTNSGVSNLEDNAFCYALDLQDLSLSNNALVAFNSRSLSPENRLRALDLSYNVLNDFSDFNISYFPRLSVLNVGNNFLSYLPVSIINMLKDENEFYLVVDNNPWNCSDPNWSEHLTDRLVDIFCKKNTYNYTSQTPTESTEFEDISAASTEKDAFDIHQHLIENDTENVTAKIGQTESETTEKTPCEKPNCLKCSFYYCLIWFSCGIWIGIILGNIVKIKALICGRPVTYVDEYTQCEYSLVEQHMVSGVFDPQERRFKAISTVGPSIPTKEKT